MLIKHAQYYSGHLKTLYKIKPALFKRHKISVSSDPICVKAILSLWGLDESENKRKRS